LRFAGAPILIREWAFRRQHCNLGGRRRQRAAHQVLLKLFRQPTPMQRHLQLFCSAPQRYGFSFAPRDTQSLLLSVAYWPSMARCLPKQRRRVMAAGEGGVGVERFPQDVGWLYLPVRGQSS